MACNGKIDQWIFYLMGLFALTTCIVPRVANYILAVAVLLGILRWKKQRPDWCMPKPYARALLVFFGAMFLSIWLSPDIITSAKEFWRFVNRLLAGAVILLFIKEEQELLKIFFAFLVSMCINNIYAIYKGIGLIAAGAVDVRSFGFENGAIILSGHLLLAVPLLFILLLERRPAGWQKYIAAAFGLALAALLLNGTRIAWVILAVLLPALVVIYLKDWKKLLLLCLTASFLCTAAIYTMPFLQQRLLSFTDAKQVSNQGHYFIMRDSLQMIKEQPILGVGLGRYQKVFNEKYRSPEHIALEPGLTPHAHDNTLTIWAETGVFGCLAFWFMFGSFLYYSLKRWLKRRQASDLMFFTITLAAVLQGITDYSFGFNQVVKIYFCLLAIYLNHQRYETKATVDPDKGGKSCG